MDNNYATWCIFDPNGHNLQMQLGPLGEGWEHLLKPLEIDDEGGC